MSPRYLRTHGRTSVTVEPRPHETDSGAEAEKPKDIYANGIMVMTGCERVKRRRDQRISIGGPSELLRELLKKPRIGTAKATSILSRHVPCATSTTRSCNPKAERDVEPSWPHVFKLTPYRSQENRPPFSLVFCVCISRSSCPRTISFSLLRFLCQPTKNDMYRADELSYVDPSCLSIDDPSILVLFISILSSSLARPNRATTSTHSHHHATFPITVWC